MADPIYTSFFRQIATDTFAGNDPARGPWSPDACHAGPPTGLLARSLEHLVDDKQLTRLSVDLLRPIPMAGFAISTNVARAGRAVTTTTAELISLEGKVCASARGLHCAYQPDGALGEVPTPAIDSPVLADAIPGAFPLNTAPHNQPFFPNGVEARYPPGEDNTPGPTTMWLRALPLLDDETPSPFQSLCPLADCGNASSRNADPGSLGFVNPDLTIVMHRPPTTEWLASSALSHWHPHGTGVAHATLFDEHGPVATATQTLLITSPS